MFVLRFLLEIYTLYAYCVGIIVVSSHSSCVNRITMRRIPSSSDTVYTTDETRYKQLYNHIYVYNG